MRFINDIIVHCTATPMGKDFHAQDIRNMHIKNGWNDIGYHYLITLDGTIEKGRPISKAGAHCLYHNAHSVGVCYVGGCDINGKSADTRTDAQKNALRKLIYDLVQLYRCDVHGHHDYNKNKDCPCFNAHEEYGGFYRRLVLSASCKPAKRPEP